MKLGVIARADLTGLGVQSRNWVRLLNPHKVIIIDSTSFNGNEQHFEWYKNCPHTYMVDGFITSAEIDSVLFDIDVLLTFEIPYNYELIAAAKLRGIKTIIINNWEFTDYLQQPILPLPDLLINHSYWNLDMQRFYWPEITDYCPTPILIEDYDEIMLYNMDRSLEKRRFVHIAGRKAYKERNGTQDLLEAVKLIPKNIKFELVIKTQTTEFVAIDDPRITVDRSSPVDEKELYRNFDAMILPRRYGGASLPMTEALASALPVIMTDVEPNNQVLPRDWLVKCEKTDEFTARTLIDVYSADYEHLAEKIIDLAICAEEDLLSAKILAREIAVKEYSDEEVKHKWDLLMDKLRV